MQKPLVFLSFVAILIASFLFFAQQEVMLSESGRANLTVAFLDVGQGDATFIESPNGTQVLVDGGRGDAAVLRELPKFMSPFDRSIDVVIATHPDSDHIGGLIDVLARYEVKTIIMTNNVNDTPAYDAFM